MHVLIATDGQLDASAGADFAARLAGSDGSVTVLSVVEVPRRLLADLRRGFFGDISERAISVDHETVNVRETIVPEESGWPGDDAMLDRYLSDQGAARTSSLVAALRSHGIEPTIDIREGESPASDILKAIDDLGADVVCIGSHGQGLFEGLLGSVGTKLTRLAPVPLVLIRKR
jgi:nucleotide-binding universal stress UspA family protein